MAKRGRPRKAKADDGQQEAQPLVRLDPDLVMKLNWIVYLKKRAGDKGFTSGQYIEPLIRQSIQNDFKLIEADVESIRRLEMKAGQKLKESGQEE